MMPWLLSKVVILISGMPVGEVLTKGDSISFEQENTSNKNSKEICARHALK
jgi:hypothetical protein